LLTPRPLLVFPQRFLEFKAVKEQKFDPIQK